MWDPPGGISLANHVYSFYLCLDSRIKKNLSCAAPSRAFQVPHQGRKVILVSELHA